MLSEVSPTGLGALESVYFTFIGQLDPTATKLREHTIHSLRASLVNNSFRCITHQEKRG